jgi:hypothetical protein
LNSYLRIFNSCLPLAHKQKITKRININWITTGIRVSCAQKRTLYLRIIKEGNLALKGHYSKYCKILKKVIVAAKKMAYDDFISKFHNKLKSTWKIINSEKGRINKQNNFRDLIEKFKNQTAADLENDYFISIGNKLMSDNDNNSNAFTTKSLPFMYQAISKNYPKICYDPSTPKEIENTIKTFKAKDSCGYDLIPMRITKLSAPVYQLPIELYLQ